MTSTSKLGHAVVWRAHRLARAVPRRADHRPRFDVEEADARAAEVADAWGLDMTSRRMARRHKVIYQVKDGDDARALIVHGDSAEATHAAEALAAWGTRGCAAVYRESSDHGAYLMELLDTTDPLVRHPIGDRAVRIGHLATVIEADPREIEARPASDMVQHLSERTERLSSNGYRPLSARTLASLATVAAEVAGERGESVVHSDLHGFNIGRRHGGGYVAIDPKPALAPRAFALQCVAMNGHLRVADRHSDIPHVVRLAASAAACDPDLALRYSAIRIAAAYAVARARGRHRPARYFADVVNAMLTVL